VSKPMRNGEKSVVLYLLGISRQFKRYGKCLWFIQIIFLSKLVIRW